MILTPLLVAGLSLAQARPSPRADDRPARALLARADVLLARGRLPAALALARSARSAAGPGAAAMDAVSELVRGAAAEQQESARVAAGHYESALHFADAAASAPLVARAFSAVVGEYYAQGQWDRVLALANARLAQAAGADQPNRATYLAARGAAYSELHDPRAAGEAFAEALPLAEADGNAALAGKLHRYKGLLIWRYERDLPRAQQEYALALVDARRARAWLDVVNILINSANPYRNAAVGDLPRALAGYTEALAMARREHLTELLPNLLKNIGDVYRQQGNRERARRVLTEGMERADRSNVTEVRWTTRLELGMLARDHDPALAERYFAECLDLLDAKEGSVLLEDLRAGALAGAILFADPYDEYIDFLLARHRPADAFLVAERQRARVFLDTLSAARESLAPAVPAGFVEQEHGLLERITLAQAELRAGAASETRRRDLLAAIEQSESALDQLRLRLAIERPALALARYPTLWTVPALQARVIGQDEALVSVYLGQRGSVAWIITRDALRTVALPPRRTIEPRVRAALTALRDPVAPDGQAIAALSDVLHAGDMATAAARPRLVILPFGALYDLPFDVLLDGAGRPLLERFAIWYAPSASALAFLRSRPARPAGDLALVTVANPVVGLQRSTGTRPADLAHLDLLTPVPSTAEEAHQIARLFGSRARVLEGSRATRAELEQSGMGHARILHFATHGLIDEERPDRSGLLLTSDPPNDDGLLQVRQIYGLHLDADLVTLSACETALGLNVTGEGMIGLTRAFFYAGARAVVASLWDVEDATTSRLMQAFYARLRAGQPIDIALQGAKLALLHEGGAASRPFYWASFVASGEARIAVADPPPPRSARATRAMAIGAGALVVVGVLGVGWRRRRAAAGVTAAAA